MAAKGLRRSRSLAAAGVIAIGATALMVQAGPVSAPQAALSASASNGPNSFDAGFWATIQAIANGSLSSCVTTANDVKCWGDNSKGQLGDGTTTQRNTPAQVSGVGGTGTLSGVEDIGMGQLHTCAAEPDGAIYCWGFGDLGRLGNNAMTDSSSPVQVVGVGGSGTLSGVDTVGLGSAHSCAGDATGSAYCWGGGAAGQLGNGATSDSVAPVVVSGLSDIVDIDGGDAHSCAIAAGGVRCWGLGSSGQLGDGGTASSSVPVAVSMPSTGDVRDDFDAVSFSGTNGTIAWSGPWIELVETDGPSTGKVEVENPYWWNCSGASNCLVIGGESSGSVDEKGVERSADLSAASSATLTYTVDRENFWSSGGSVVVQMSANGTVWDTIATYPWGGGFSGGAKSHDVSSYLSATTAVRVVGVGTEGGYVGFANIRIETDLGATQLGVAGDHSCALGADQTVWCWGDNSNGQLGDGTTTQRNTPVQVQGAGGVGFLTNVVSVAAGTDHTCAADSSGGAWCWGRNDLGQLGDGSTTQRLTPVQVVGSGGVGLLSNVTIAGASEFDGGHSCHVEGQTAVWCNGKGDKGQLGDGLVSDSSTPVGAVI